MLRMLTPREEKLLQLLNSVGYETVERALKAQGDIAYNMMLGNLEDPNADEEEE